MSNQMTANKYKTRLASDLFLYRFVSKSNIPCIWCPTCILFVDLLKVFKLQERRQAYAADRGDTEGARSGRDIG